MAKKPNNRLGAGKFARSEIQTHPFFNGVDWEAANTKEWIDPPIIPKIVGHLSPSLLVYFSIKLLYLFLILETSQGYMLF